MPGDEIPQISWFEKIHGDKLVHISLFFLLVIGFSFPFYNTSITIATRLHWFLCLTIIGILYGIAVEFIQKYFIPFRSFGIDDMVADAIGCIAGYYCAKRFFIK